MANLFLLKEDGGFLLQENGGKFIIGEVADVEGGGSGGSSKAVGVSLVEKQLGKPSVAERLGDRPHRKAISFINGKLAFEIKNYAYVRILRPFNHARFSHLIEAKVSKPESHFIECKLTHYESYNMRGQIHMHTTNSVVGETAQHPFYKVLQDFTIIRDEIEYKHVQAEKKEKIRKLKDLLNLINDIPINQEIMDTPIIQVTLGTKEIEQGGLLRITADINKQVPQLWMRILGTNSVIVQKAGLVKRDATGFQILVSTQQLEKGNYTIQVSDGNTFSPLGVADFEVKGKSPIVPVIAITTGIIAPNFDDQEVEWVVYRTMMDTKVDAICKKVENKRFRLDDKNKPEIPQHFNCRCFYEVD